MLPGDGIVLYPSHAREPFAYYERRRGSTGPENIPGNDARFAGNRRIWLVLRASAPGARGENVDRIKGRLREQHRLIRLRAFDGVSVHLYAPRP
jgi:hypothetical protein